MPFFTRPHFEDRQIVQYSGESITLSGQTHYSNTGQAIVNSTILYEEPEFPLTGATSGQTTITLVGLTGYMYESNFRSNGGGLIIKPPILKLSGSTGYTTTDVTGYVLKALDSGGTITWAPISVSADTNTFVTGGTLNGTNLDLTWNTGGSVPSIDLSPLSASTNFANTDLTLTGDRVHDLSGYTVTLKDEKDDQTRLIVENLFNGGSANSAVSVRSRGAGAVTISGTILYGGDSFNGYGSFTDGGSGLLTNAFSMTSLGGTPSQRGNINIGSRRGTDAEVRIFNGGDDFDFTSLGAKFTTTGFTSYQDVYIDNLPSESVLGTDANGKIIAGTGGGTFTGNTSGDCITDLYLTNLYGCSPLHIEPSGVNDVYIVENGGNVGIGTTTPSEKLHVKDGSALIEHNQDTSTRLDIKNYNGGNDAFAQFALSVSGTSSSNAKFGSIIAVGPDSVPTGSFMGSYLPNSLNIITANGSAATRMHINIGSRRTNGETRFFSGEDFDVSNLVGVVYSTGLTITDMVNTNTLRVRNGANLGYVLTSDANGVGTWQAPGGGLFWEYGNAEDNSLMDINGTHTQSATGMNFTMLAGGQNNTGTTSSYAFIGGGLNNEIVGSIGSGMIAGSSNLIDDSSTAAFIGGGSYNKIITGVGSSILGGEYNIISGTTGGPFNSIITSSYSVLNGVTGSTIIGGSNITGTTDDTVYVPNLTVTNDHILHSDSVLEVEDLPSTFEDELKGQVTYFSWSGLTTHTTSNDNPEGRVGFLMGNFSNFPTTKTYGFLTYYNSGYTRTGTPPVGADFYRDKLVLKAADGANGLIINPQATNPSGNLWFELDGSSVMKLKGDGTGKANLGIAMNPDGTEDATANLQIGGTGTTGTIKLVDGNQQAGYVLTSDADGNASWAASAGGGGVTIDPYYTEPSNTTFTWDVSGNSTNYQITLTGGTTLEMSNVRNGDYGTIILTQDATGSRTLTFGNVNGGAGTHKVVNGGGGAVILTSTANASDILTFTYNGNTMWWSAGYNYT